MFLLRMAFWLSVVVMLIPSDESPATKTPSAEDPELSVNGAIGAAAATVSDMAGFCERNREVCETGSAAFDIFLAKAENGARLAYRIVTDEKPGSADSSRRDQANAREAGFNGSGPTSSPPHGTLRETDLLPAWQGPRDEDI